MLWLYLLIFFGSGLILYFCGEWVVGTLMRIARFLEWKEFVVAFFLMAFAASLPNFFLGLASALNKIPELSLGDIIGGNVVDLTLAVALAVLFSKKKEISTESKTVQNSSIFTLFTAILPLILVLDKKLSRSDGILLIFLFAFYVFWLFSKKERFAKIYEEKIALSFTEKIATFFKDLGKFILGIFLLILAVKGIIASAQFFSQYFKIPVFLIGALIVSLENALPEIYFAIISAKKGETWMILGDLMGAVIVPTTLVLGTVALISPIKVDFPAFALGRFFLAISAIFFFFFTKSDRKITKRESFFLLTIYILFVFSQILAK